MLTLVCLKPIALSLSLLRDHLFLLPSLFWAFRSGQRAPDSSPAPLAQPAAPPPLPGLFPGCFISRWLAPPSLKAEETTGLEPEGLISAKRSQSDGEGQMPYDFTHLWTPKTKVTPTQQRGG